jgi:VanZ family protein
MQKLFQIAGWFVAFLIVILSIVPPSLRPVTDLPHNLEHALIFLVTGASFEIGYPRRFFVNAMGLTAFAGAVELAQLWSSGRHARMSDFIVDALAALIGVGIAWLALRSRMGAILNPTPGS